MALGDIKFLQGAPGNSQSGVKVCNVAAAATTIYPGDPVQRAVAGVTVAVMDTNEPLAQNAGTAPDPMFVGIAMTQSTQTASAAGKVTVAVAKPGQIYLIKPNVATSWNTQAKYDALVGKRVLIDLTTGTYTILASDSALNGCVVEALNIAEHPGIVAFSVRRTAWDAF